jgi:uncharacterized protein HemY
LLYLAQAQAFIAVGDYRSAYDNILDGLDIVPDWLDVELNLTEIYGDPEEFSSHLRTLEEWVEKHPTDYRSHFTLAYVYYFLQEFDLARRELVYALANDRDHEHANRMMAEIRERQAEEDAAPAVDKGQL